MNREPDETTRIGWTQARVLNRIQARILRARALKRNLIALELIELRDEIRGDMDLEPHSERTTA